jgi:hypothetical protein
MKVKTIEREGRKLLQDALKLVGIGRLDIPNYRGIFQLGPD